MDRKQVGAWAMFDFANSVYPAVITTAIFSRYYAGTIVGGETGEGTAFGIGPGTGSGWRPG